MDREIVIVPWGPTQIGKTSFLNRFGGVSAATGTGRGVSVTSSPQLYETEITWPDSAQRQRVSLIDVPGLNDTEMRFRNAFVSEMIHIYLGDRDIPRIDALLVMQSVADSNNQLKNTLKNVVNTFGRKIQLAIIVVMTKIDIAQKSAPKMKDSIIQFCRESGLKYIEWSNECSDTDFVQQMRNFHAVLQQTSPYFLQANADLRRVIEQRAFQLREDDPERFIAQRIEIPIQQAEVYQETTHWETTEVMRRYQTAAEILAAAKELQRNGPKDFKQITGKIVMQPVTVYVESYDGIQLFGVSLFGSSETVATTQWQPI